MSVDVQRSLVRNALEMNLSCASLLAQQLTGLTGASSADKLLCAQCYYRQGEYRRCLSYLELEGFLFVNSIRNVLDFLEENQPEYSVEAQTKLLALLLAGQCLVATDQFDDCLLLLEPFCSNRLDGEFGTGSWETQAKHIWSYSNEQVNPLAGILCLLGKCFDRLENRIRSTKLFQSALRIDPACLDAGEHLVTNYLLTPAEKGILFESMEFEHGREWLREHYRVLLGQSAGESEPLQSSSESPTASQLVKRAEYYCENQMPDEAYRLARQAYTMDPYDKKCLLIYVGSLVELGLKTELFYLGHELTNTMPKQALSWYVVGCYYWCCSKYELAQKYLHKSTKLDKRFPKALLALGHVMSIQEESEQAIGAYRAASRLMPGDHRPLVLMAKELARTSYDSQALHMLNSAAAISPADPAVWNELGVTYLRLNRLEDALVSLQHAVDILLKSSRQNNEIFSNYATALRKNGRLADALKWYEVSLSGNPNDFNTHAAIGFTLHLLRRFDEAISSYHRALALNPHSAFCAEMLNNIMVDAVRYPSLSSDSAASSASHSTPNLRFSGTNSFDKSVRSSHDSFRISGKDFDVSTSFTASPFIEQGMDVSPISR